MYTGHLSHEDISEASHCLYDSNFLAVLELSKIQA